MLKILAPTDFSNASKNATIYAAHLAKDLQMSLTLFHAYHVAYVPTADAPMAVNADPAEVQKDNVNLLHQEANSLVSVNGVEIECIAKEGFAVDEILAYEETQDPDLIVMGLTSAGSVREFLLGSIATDVMSKTKTPVLIVPEKAAYKPIKKIAFASDYLTEPDADELKTLKHMLKINNAKLYILNVEKEKEDIEIDMAIQMMKMENHFDDIEHTHHLPIDDDLIHGLNTFIAEHDIDLIAMIPHKHNLLSRMFKESNTKKMAFHTTIPLLTLHSSHRGY